MSSFHQARSSATSLSSLSMASSTSSTATGLALGEGTQRCSVCEESDVRRRVRNAEDILHADFTLSDPESVLDFTAQDVEKAEALASRSLENSGRRQTDVALDAKRLRAKIRILSSEYARVSSEISLLVEQNHISSARVSETIASFTDKLHKVHALISKEECALQIAEQERDALKQELEIDRQRTADERARRDRRPDEGNAAAEERGKVKKVATLLEELRNKRCRDIYELWPVLPGFDAHGVVGTVGDFRISVSQNISAGLLSETCSGYALLVRMLTTISAYLEIPPRHPTDVSVEVAAVIDTDGNSTPLTPSSSDFGLALRLLSENVCQLCVLQGVPQNLVDSDPRSVLQNAWQLFHCPSLGRDINRCLSDAERRVGSNPRRTSSVDINPLTRSDLATLLIRGNALLVLDLGLDVLNGVRRLRSVLTKICMPPRRRSTRWSVDSFWML